MDGNAGRHSSHGHIPGRRNGRRDADERALRCIARHDTPEQRKPHVQSHGDVRPLPHCLDHGQRDRVQPGDRRHTTPAATATAAPAPAADLHVPVDQQRLDDRRRRSMDLYSARRHRHEGRLLRRRNEQVHRQQRTLRLQRRRERARHDDALRREPCVQGHGELSGRHHRDKLRHGDRGECLRLPAAQGRLLHARRRPARGPACPVVQLVPPPFIARRGSHAPRTTSAIT